MRQMLASCLFAALLGSCASTGRGMSVGDLDLPPDSSQALLCTTPSWNDSAATVLRLERTREGWTPIGDPIPARVGRSGLGWGLGLHRDGDGPKKREGDGRAPAGVFALGPAFGYAADPPTGVTVPYRQATERDYFVDAADSPDYNRWRHIPEGEPNDPAERWSSFEHMRRADALYEFGLVVGHNPECLPGRGSAIFVHVWRDPDSPTAGCTAMARKDLLRVLAWLRPEAHPVLVQAPEGVRIPRR